MNIISNDSFSYNGKLNIKLEKNGLILDDKVFYNHGSLQLFDYLVKCLGGKAISAESKRPTMLQGFLYEDGREQVLTKDKIKQALKNPMAQKNNSTDEQIAGITVTPATTRVAYNELPRYSYNEGKRTSAESDNGILEDAASVTYHFRIPAVYITANKINMFCLYYTTAELINFSACFLLTKEDDQGNPIDWDWLDFSDQNDNYNLIIDWTLTIKN